MFSWGIFFTFCVPFLMLGYVAGWERRGRKRGRKNARRI
nr:MAG TPA: chitin synthase regulator [Bacteriophage sp.]